MCTRNAKYGDYCIYCKYFEELTTDEINSLLAVVENQKYRVLFMLAIMSGARQGELIGLK